MSEETPSAPGGSVPSDPPAPGGPIVARAGTYYRRARYFVCGMLFIFGLWFCNDGFVRYPEYNRRFDAMSAEQRIQQHMEKRYDAMGLFIQRAIGVTLPPVGIGLLLFFLYRSRGEYRLEGHTLHVPGHPPVPVDRITELDRRLWDRKGIMIVHYALIDGAGTARLKLDDFVYDRTATDAIITALTKQLFPGEGSDKGQGQD